MATKSKGGTNGPQARPVINLHAEATRRARAFLPLNAPVIDDVDEKAVLDALKSAKRHHGAAVERCEDGFKEVVEAQHAVLCSSGTAALHLAMLSLGLGEGAAVLVPAISFAATANAARLAGAEVLFADVDPESGLMTPGHVKAVLTRLKRNGAKPVNAIISVHLNGQCTALADIDKIAKAADAFHVEDACQALGARYRAGQNVISVGACAHSDIACFSFHGLSGEGGVLSMKDAVLGEKACRLRAHGIAHTEKAFDEHDDEVVTLGLNYGLSDMQAALILSQLRKLDGFIAKRRALSAVYDVRLEQLFPLVVPVVENAGVQSARSHYGVLIDFEKAGTTRPALRAALKAQNVETGVHYRPLADQPYYLRRYGAQEIPGARAFAARCLSLPLHPAMTEKHVDQVIAALSRELG